ncbi:uncharacterized protein [Palaemon carinicauda]|uniref:uncharacterized protein n=1 Tax=Palaemon carinicauda TaxID=392227 RepID=UPI0035B61C1C
MKTTTSYTIIQELMKMFSTHGIPERIVTENGPQFVSQEFIDFCEVNGIKHTFPATYHPSTNGEAESDLEEKGYKQLESLSKVRHFPPCSNVVVRSYTSPENWVPRGIVKEIGNLLYDVQAGGNIVKRHLDQLQPLNRNPVDHVLGVILYSIAGLEHVSA